MCLTSQTFTFLLCQFISNDFDQNERRGDLKKQMSKNIEKWGGHIRLEAKYHTYNVVKIA